MLSSVRYLLLQIRNPDDPMRGQEIACFARALSASSEQFTTLDLLTKSPAQADLDRHDVILLGGSGHYSATPEPAPPWLERTMETLRELHAVAKPTFASCWGFQAFSRALGGEVVHDLERAELGTHTLQLTDAGRSDPVFGPLGETFAGQMGHEDRVSRLPPGATLLAFTQRVENQAYCFAGKPIYCTQFHPELNRSDLLQRVHAYPSYVERVAGMTLKQFEDNCRDTPETEALLPRFVQTVLA